MSQTDPGLPKRAANIGASRSSKCASHGHGRYYLLMKSVRDGVAWRDGRGRVFDLAEATQVAGAGVLALAAQDDWVSGQPLWLVENQALFDRLDWMPDAARGSVAYYAGQIPEFLLNWLAARPRAEQTVLFPDYDGVGLLNFARLRKRCACPCSFWLMPDWKNRLRRFGNKEIWVNTLPNFHAALAELRSSGMDESLADFCQVLSREGLALEQEAIWL